MSAKINGVCGVLVDPELKHVGQNNVAVCKPFVSFNRRYRKGEEFVEERCAVTLELWGGAAEKFVNNVKKGDQVYIEGYLALNEWTDNEQQKRKDHLIKVEVFYQIVRQPKDQNSQGGQQQSQAQTQKPKTNTAPKPAPRQAATPPQSQAAPRTAAGPAKPAANKPVPRNQPAPQQEEVAAQVSDDEVPF